MNGEPGTSIDIVNVDGMQSLFGAKVSEKCVFCWMVELSNSTERHFTGEQGNLEHMGNMWNLIARGVGLTFSEDKSNADVLLLIVEF